VHNITIQDLQPNLRLARMIAMQGDRDDNDASEDEEMVSCL
jgi:hypothetical protein